MMGKGSHRMFLEQSEAIVKQGVPVVPQVACRPLNFEFDLAEPFVVREHADLQARSRRRTARARRAPTAIRRSARR